VKKSEPTTRKFINQRTICIKGYECENGGLEIEGTLVDTRTEAITLLNGNFKPQGTPLHSIQSIMTLSEDMIIEKLTVDYDALPDKSCIVPYSGTYDNLIGIDTKKNLKIQLRDRIPRAEGCTHLNVLIDIMAASAFQTAYNRQKQETGCNFLDNSCYTWNTKSPSYKILKKALSQQQLKKSRKDL
tara:strand:- start:5557 stop:6114 length:558 start_codon:yes stop_codon:yes gene_type:complete